jgi:hypothetical protein
MSDTTIEHSENELSDFEFARIAKRYAKLSLAALVRTLQNSDDERLVLQAAQEILSRAYGRPPQGVQIPAYLTAEEAQELFTRSLKKAREEGYPTDD